MKNKKALSAEEEFINSINSTFRTFESEVMSQKMKQILAIRKEKMNGTNYAKK